MSEMPEQEQSDLPEVRFKLASVDLDAVLLGMQLFGTRTYKSTLLEALKRQVEQRREQDRAFESLAETGRALAAVLPGLATAVPRIEAAVAAAAGDIEGVRATSAELVARAKAREAADDLPASSGRPMPRIVRAIFFPDKRRLAWLLAAALLGGLVWGVSEIDRLEAGITEPGTVAPSQ